MVDAYVTPSGLSTLMTGGQPGDGATTAAAASTGTAPDRSISVRDVRYAFFTGPAAFRIDLEAKDKSGVVTLLFAWNGRWRLTRIFLPLDDAHPQQAG
jgi:hypothetical protein